MPIKGLTSRRIPKGAVSCVKRQEKELLTVVKARLRRNPKRVVNSCQRLNLSKHTKTKTLQKGLSDSVIKSQ
jgi:hypothetical protein